MPTAIEAWKEILKGKRFVVFENGTCVVVTNGDGNLRDIALDIISEFGPVHVGSSFGDFSVVELKDDWGWVVTSHHNDLMTFVAREEFDGGKAPEEFLIGIYGRGKRGDDAEQQKIVFEHEVSN